MASLGHFLYINKIYLYTKQPRLMRPFCFLPFENWTIATTMSHDNKTWKSFCFHNNEKLELMWNLYQARIPGIESTVKIFQTNDAWPEFVIAKLYDQLLRGVSVVGDTTMHKYLS